MAEHGDTLENKLAAIGVFVSGPEELSLKDKVEILRLAVSLAHNTSAYKSVYKGMIELIFSKQEA